MLFKSENLIAPATFALIQQLQQIPHLKGFHLAGGTSLALQIGHRNSVDIDLFSVDVFDAGLLAEELKSRLPFVETYRRKATTVGFIDNVKVDFITHSYPLVQPLGREEGITLFSKADIAAMKLNAIVNSGQRLKDYIDIYFLLEHFCLQEMVEFYAMKYRNTNPMMAFKSVAYFDDLDQNEDVPIVFSAFDIGRMKERLRNAVQQVNTVFGKTI